MNGGGISMARMQIRGLSEYTKKLEKLESQSKEITGKCLYDGASVVASAVKSAINQIPTRSPDAIGSEGKTVSGLTAIEKAGLVNSFGITKMRDSSFSQDVKLGFDGYNMVRTKKFPNGQPNQLIARSIESGTSFLQPCHFMSKAVNASRAACLAKMESTCDSEIEKIMGGN